jgi:hypothetical protein
LLILFAAADFEEARAAGRTSALGRGSSVFQRYWPRVFYFTLCFAFHAVRFRHQFQGIIGTFADRFAVLFFELPAMRIALFHLAIFAHPLEKVKVSNLSVDFLQNQHSVKSFYWKSRKNKRFPRTQTHRPRGEMSKVHARVQNFYLFEGMGKNSQLPAALARARAAFDDRNLRRRRGAGRTRNRGAHVDDENVSQDVVVLQRLFATRKRLWIQARRIDSKRHLKSTSS